MSGFPLVYIALATACLWLLYNKISTSRRHAILAAKNGCKPPGTIRQLPLLQGVDVGLRFLGWVRGENFIRKFDQMLKERGKTVFYSSLGTKRAWTMQPENVQVLLNSEDWNMSWTRCMAFRPYIGHGIIASNGEVWARGRALLRPAFVKSQIANFDVYEEHLQKLIALIPTDGSTVDLQPLFHRYTIDIISEMLCGESLNSLDPKAGARAQEIEDAYNGAAGGVIVRLNMGWLMYLHRDAHFAKSCRTLHKYFSYYIDKAMENKVEDKCSERKSPGSSSDRYVFVDQLVQETDDRQFLRDQVVGAMSAGRNSTASLLSCIFYFLARHPRVWKLLQEKIEIFEGQPPTYEQLQKIQYLQWVMKETMRLLPPFAFNERAAIRDTTLPVGGGPDGKSPIFVEKGRIVGAAIWSIGHSTEYWGVDAEEFRPERWSDLSKNDSRFWNFGAGPRTCPGQTLALNEAAYTLVRMLQTYRHIENRDDRPWKENIKVTLKLGNGCNIALSG